ncbi:MAG: response regulator [Patescibacteria group bacterium]|nr:response regulator [Patescibacteria group bacterium]MDE2116496.1 response regulator [Patescibacteria group bacterium]
MKILVIDDEQVIRSSVKLRLEHQGHEVIVAPDGEIGVLIAKENPDLDIVISDWNMPRKDGLTALGEIKALIPAVRAFLMTGDYTGDASLMKRAAGLGIEQVLSKTDPDTREFFDSLAKG